MGSKFCYICNTNKSLNEFYYSKNGKYSSDCKLCNKASGKKRYELNKEKVLKRCSNYRENNKSKIKEYHKNNYLKNRERILETTKLYSETHRDSRNATRKKRYYKDDSFKIYQRSWRMNKRKTDPQYKLSVDIRNRIRVALKRKKWNKSNKFNEYIGCSLEELKQHLEKQFKPGMTWKNHGIWHIDHIIPLAAAKNPEELYILSHYKNLQPLWAKENMQKSDKCPENLNISKKKI